MKKATTLLLGIWGGLIALTSCSDNIYQEIDEQNNEMNAPPTFNNDSIGFAHGGSGGSGLIWMGGNYASPWDIWFRYEHEFQPNYIISNGNMEHVTNYNIEVYAYIGLAYFDGVDDGSYDDPALNPSGPPVPVVDLTNGNYPNLYPQTVLNPSPPEVGNLVKTVIPIHSDAYPAPTHGLRLEDIEHHILFPGSPTDRYPWLSQGWAFDFAGTITPQEQALLREYGKVFFYEVHVYDKFTNALVHTAIMHPKIETLPSGSNYPDWKEVKDLGGNHILGTIPVLGSPAGLYFYNAGLPNGTVWDMNNLLTPGTNRCDSREVVFDVQHLYESPIPGGGGAKLVLDIAQNSQYLWRNASLHLSVQN